LVPSRSVLEFALARSPIGSGYCVRQRGQSVLVYELLGQGLPSIDFARRDLTGGEQCPEQHRCRLGGWQHRLRLDAALELRAPRLDQSFNRVAPRLASKGDVGRRSPQDRGPSGEKHGRLSCRQSAIATSHGERRKARWETADK